jgi:hypothetical protein
VAVVQDQQVEVLVAAEVKELPVKQILAVVLVRVLLVVVELYSFVCQLQIMTYWAQ